MRRSKQVIAQNYSDSPDDQKDWIRVTCAALGNLIIMEDKIE